VCASTCPSSSLCAGSPRNSAAAWSSGGAAETATADMVRWPKPRPRAAARHTSPSAAILSACESESRVSPARQQNSCRKRELSTSFNSHLENCDTQSGQTVTTSQRFLTTSESRSVTNRSSSIEVSARKPRSHEKETARPAGGGRQQPRDCRQHARSLATSAVSPLHANIIF